MGEPAKLCKPVRTVEISYQNKLKPALTVALLPLSKKSKKMFRILQRNLLPRVSKRGCVPIVVSPILGVRKVARVGSSEPESSILKSPRHYTPVEGFHNEKRPMNRDGKLPASMMSSRKEKRPSPLWEETKAFYEEEPQFPRPRKKWSLLFLVLFHRPLGLSCILCHLEAQRPQPA